MPKFPVKFPYLPELALPPPKGPPRESQCYLIHDARARESPLEKYNAISCYVDYTAKVEKYTHLFSLYRLSDPCNTLC